MATTLGNINLFVRDIEGARRFYVEVVGLEQSERSHPPSFFLLRAGGCTLTLQNAEADGAAFGPTPSIELGFAVDDVAAARERMQAAGGSVSALQQMGWGEGFDAADPEGHRLTFYRMRG